MRLGGTWLWLLASAGALGALTLAPTAARAQTVGELAARGECSTAGTEGLNDQLIRNHVCLFPGVFVELDHPSITLASSRVYPLVTATARDRIENAADTVPMTLNSAFRTLAQQFVLYESGGCAVAAEPGSSNHETGRAIDVDDWSTARDALLASGCTHPLPDSDPVHFECGGPDMRMSSVLTFQMLWNENNPGDIIAEDGLYGPQTRGRMQMSPAGGFSEDVCVEEIPDGGVPDAGTPDAGVPDGSLLPDGAGTGRVTRLPEGGCSCRTTASGGVPLAWLLLPLALAVRRRRR